jgi:hypothetical protein
LATSQQNSAPECVPIQKNVDRCKNPTDRIVSSTIIGERAAQTVTKMEKVLENGKVLDESRDLAATFHLGGESRMSQVEQMDAAIARHGSAVPSYLDLMGGDACDRAQPGGLVAVLADPDDAVGQRKPASHGGIHVGPPD